MKKILIAMGIIVVILVGYFGYYFIAHPDQRMSLFKIQDAMGKNNFESDDSFSDRLVKELQKYYGKSIADRSIQASLISIRDFVITTHPKNGKELFYSIIKRAFPDYADEIMKTLAKLDEYNRWLEKNKTLSQTDLEGKRKELFGEEAEKIWSNAVLAAEARKVKMKNTFDVLNKSDDTTLNEKINMYKNALRDTYEGAPEEVFIKQMDLSMAFFSLDSVQNDLKQMSPEQRQLEMNNIRRQMGWGEEQIKEMEEIDADNEQKWDVGLAYMEDRKKIVENYKGPEQEEKLKALREKYFQDEANTIEREENNDNFFRFERPHIYGRN